MIMLKLGIRSQNLPSEEEKKVLISHIYTHYGEHTVQEVKLAFEMGMEGKLEVKMEAYENFSCLYFSTVMNAYRDWARKEIKHVSNTFMDRIKEEEEKPKESLSDKTYEEWMEDQRKKINEGMIVDLVPMMLYDYAIGKGLISPSNQQKKECLVIAAKYMQGKLNANVEDRDSAREAKEFNEMMGKGEITGKWVDTLKVLAKKQILYDFLKNK